MFTEDRPIIIDRQFLVIASRHILDIRDLYVDEYAIRINYRVTPPAHRQDPAGDSLLFTWGGSAVDNLGNYYNSCGGACGLSADGKFTEGVLSFMPVMEEDTLFLDFFTTLLAKKDVLFLDFVFIPERIKMTAEYTFRVLLP